jgi:sodium-dependent dicarboxylate transporter 2/3/5
LFFSYRSFGRNAWGAKVKEVYDCNIVWVAYGCSIGGIATLVGTLLIFLCGFWNNLSKCARNFGQWLIFALPLSLIMFAVILAVLYIMFPPQKILRY